MVDRTHNQPPLEVWRLKALEWADLDAAAHLLADGKSSVFSEWTEELIAEGMAISKAERTVKASERYRDYLKKMNAARKRANRAKVAMDYAKEKLWESKNADANERAEKRLHA